MSLSALLFTLHCFKSLSLLLLDAKTTVLCTFLIKKPEQLMKIETSKKITWPEITVLLGSAASMDTRMLLREITHFLYQHKKGTILFCCFNFIRTANLFLVCQ
jgi:hypothetical protein